MSGGFNQGEQSGSQTHSTGQGGQQGQSIGQKAQDIASSVAHKAQDVASGMAEKAGDALSTVGSGMTSLAGTIREKAPREGMLGSAAGAVASGLHSGGEYLSEHNVGDMLGDLSGVIRRYPIQSLLVGFGVGFLMARVTSRG
jgi:hypothetical protein